MPCPSEPCTGVSRTPRGDCNQAGQLADKVMKQLGGERMCPRGEIDVARDQVERDVAAFIDKKLLPALVP